MGILTIFSQENVPTETPPGQCESHNLYFEASSQVTLVCDELTKTKEHTISLGFKSQFLNLDSSSVFQNEIGRIYRGP